MSAHRLPRSARSARPSHRQRGAASRSVVIGGVAAATAVAAVLGVAAYGLWSDSALPADAAVSTGQVGVQLDRLASASSTTTSSQTATAATSVLTASTVRGDASTMVTATPQAVAVPLQVRLRADGNAGLRYTLAIAAPATGSVFAASTVRLFPVASAAACTPAAAAVAAATTQPNLVDIAGLATGSTAPATATAFWCLGAVYPGTGGIYTNTATASGTNAATSQPVSSTASWSAYVYARLDVNLTHTVITPGSP